MKQTLRALVAAVSIAVAGVAVAAPTSFTGTVAKVTMAADGKSAVAVVKDGKGADLSITISDTETLEQLKAKRINEGDQVRGKYEAVGGKNQSGSMRKKTAGC